jgi:hypothetical protein
MAGGGMTYSDLAQTLDDLAAWIMATFPTYLARANSGASGRSAPALKKAERKAFIPDTGPYPYCMVNLDRATPERWGQNAQMITAEVSVNFCLSEPSPDLLDEALYRYIDALADMIGANISLGGLVDQAELLSIEKDTLPADGKGFVIATLSTRTEVLAL